MKNTNTNAIKTLWAGHFTADVYSGFVNPIMPFLAANLGISLAISTFILSLSHICSSLMQPVFGYLSDSWRRRFFMISGILLSSMFLPMMGLAGNVFILSLCLIFGSIGNGFFHPQATSFINICSSQKDLAKNMSIFLALGTLGYSLGPVVSSFFVEFFKPQMLSLTSVFGLLVALMILLYVPKISDQPNKTNNINFFKAVKDIFSNKAMVVLIIFSSLKSLATQSTNILLPFLWKNIGYSAFSIGLLLFAFLIASTVGTVASSKLEKIIGMKRVMVTSFCAVLPLTVVFAVTYKTMPVVSIISYIAIGFFATLSVPINMVLAHQIMPQYKSLTSGFIGGFCWGVVGVAMSLCGYLAQKFGIINVLLAAGAVPLLCSTLVKYVPEREL